jgi:hypothetical protein
MRRMFVTGLATAALATAVAACGNDEPEDQGGNTAQVCNSAEQVQREQSDQLNQELTALQQDPELPPEEFETQAVEVAQEALVGWSEGLQEQAGRADDPELAGALTDLADGLAAAAPELTFENLETGQVPGAERLNEAGQALTEICGPTPSPTG